MVEEEPAWSAGLVDGDGSITCNGRRYVTVAIGSTDQELLLRFARVVGVGNVRGPYSYPERNDERWSRKPQFSYRAYAGGMEVVAKLCPMLGTAKRAQLAASTAKVSPRFRERIERFPMDPSSQFQFNGMSRLALAWVAGFFDAEGCFSYSQRSGVCASVTHTDTELLTRIIVATGLGKIYGPYLSTNTTQDGFERKPHYFFRTTGHNNVQSMMAMLWPWLADSKREQARSGLARVRVCHKGHLKTPGHAACAQCTRDYWKAFRERDKPGSIREPLTPYLVYAA
jgi:hypothetical protein